MKTKLLFLVPLIIFQSLAEAQDADPDKESINKLIDAYAMARDQQDAAQIRSLFTTDADQLVSSGEWRRGQEVLVAGMLRSSQGNPGDRSLEVEQIRLINPGVAIADARYTIKGSDGRADRKMWSTFIAIKKDNIWRLTAIRNMLPAQRN